MSEPFAIVSTLITTMIGRCAMITTMVSTRTNGQMRSDAATSGKLACTSDASACGPLNEYAIRMAQLRANAHGERRDDNERERERERARMRTSAT